MNPCFRRNLSLVTSTLRSTATEDGSAPTKWIFYADCWPGFTAGRWKSDAV